MSVKRLSNIESLRIISIIMIVMMHIMGNAYNTHNAINHELLFGINTIGNTGVTIFIIISGYFGIHPTISKFIKMMSVIWFYSILSYLINIFYFQESITLQGLQVTLFPVLCRKYWFITCYMVVFCFSPFLNKIVDFLSKSDFIKLLSIMLLFFVIAPTIFNIEIMKDGGKGVINMILAYLIGQYIKVYGFPKIIKERSTLLLSISLIIIYSVNWLLSWYVGHTIMPLARDNSFFIILASIAIFYKFINYHFYSSNINYIAGYVFPLYLLQGIILKILSPYYRMISEDDTFIVYLLTGTLMIVFLSIAVENIRRVIFDKMVNIITNSVETRIAKREL